MNWRSGAAATVRIAQTISNLQFAWKFLNEYHFVYRQIHMQNRDYQTYLGGFSLMVQEWEIAAKVAKGWPRLSPDARETGEGLDVNAVSAIATAPGKIFSPHFLPSLRGFFSRSIRHVQRSSEVVFEAAATGESRSLSHPSTL